MLPRKVLILQGLQGSGKTTVAKELVRSNPGLWRRVNRDDIRAMIQQSHWTKVAEKLVRKIRNSIILDCLDMGYNVIVDDTNIRGFNISDIRALVGDYAEVEVRVIDTPLEECIRRDSLREKPVGEEIIRKTEEEWKAHY